MNKKVFILSWLSLFLAALFLGVCSRKELPYTEKALVTEGVGDSAAYWLVENREASMLLYGMDDSGKLTTVYRKMAENLTAYSGAMAICNTKDTIYVVRGYYYDGAQNPSRWDVCAIDKKTGDATVLGGAKEYLNLYVTDIAEVDGILYVSGILPSTATGRTIGAITLRGGSGGNWELTQQLKTPYGVSACYHQDALLVLCQDGSILRQGSGNVTTEHHYPHTEAPDVTSVSWKVRLVSKSLHLLKITLFYLFLSCCGWVMYHSKHWKSVTLRVSALSVLFLLLMIIAALRCVFLSSERLTQSAALSAAQHIGEVKVRALEQEEIHLILSHHFYEQDAAEGILALLQPGDTLYGVSGKDIWVAASDRFAKGADNTLTPEVVDIFAQALKGVSGSVGFERNGRIIAVHVAPVLANGVQVGVLLSQYPQINEKVIMWDALTEMYILVALIFSVSLAVLLWMLAGFHKSMVALTTQMSNISTGDLTTRDALDRSDEIGVMSNALQEMCMGLSIHNYEMQLAITAYNRFIPLGLCNLLDRANILETCLGDTQNITGSVGIYAISNQEKARASLSEMEYIDFVNDFWGNLENNTKKHDGQLLYNGFDVSNLPVFYPISPADAMEAGLELIGHASGDLLKQRISPDIFVMLHHLNFNYGIGGTEEQSFPYMSSKEAEFLSTYSRKFKGTGVHMVMTEDYMRRLDTVFTSRYLGFVTSPDGSMSYKFHEILDSYSVVERNLRMSYDQRLQEAIGLFARNDFYLARNLLSVILKSNPEDGIARWYLFACEHYFHEDAESADYQLFGIDSH